MSNFVGLNTALSGLRASQMGLDTASHNVANAGTAGYTRQRVNLQAAQPFASAVGPMGTGVRITDIARLRDGFLDARVRTTLGGFAYADTRAQGLGRAEALLTEPDSGIGGALAEMWNAFEDLALDPSGPAARRQVVGALEALADRVETLRTGWRQLATDTRRGIDTDIAEVNDLLTRVAELNRLIPQQAAADGQLPNDLMDVRDHHIDRLADLIGATSVTHPDGRVTVSAGGVQLVDGLTTRPLQALADGRLALADDPTPRAFGGEIAADSRFVTEDLPALQGELDAIVDGLVTQLNAQHAGRPLPGGGTSGDLLTIDADGRLRVAADVAADPTLIAAGLTAEPHDGDNALALAALRWQPYDGVRTIEQAYQGLVTNLGTSVAGARREADAQHSLATAAQTARYSAHGVSLDEEMADVVRFQRSLEAISRVMTTIDQALDVLINRTGIVGR